MQIISISGNNEIDSAWLNSWNNTQIEANLLFKIDPNVFKLYVSYKAILFSFHT